MNSLIKFLIKRIFQPTLLILVVILLSDSIRAQAKDIKDQQTLITFRHTFSHYHLDITPILIDLSKQPDVVMEDNKGLWYNLSQPEEVGLAAPVKLLLEALPHELR